MGVPSSPAGFVVYASECNGALALGQLSVRDAQGRSIDFDVETLIGGAVLITPQSILPEGSYSVGSEPIDISDDDAGIVNDVDAGIPAVVISETLTIAPAAPRPTRLGELSRIRGECSPTFALQLDPSIEPYVSLLALDLQVDQSPLQPFIAYGTLDVTDGRALLTLRRELWSALGEGSHQLTLVARLAGEDTPLESITMAFEIDCYDESIGADEADVTCSVAQTPRAPAFIPLGALIVFATVLLARRKRARVDLRTRPLP